MATGLPVGCGAGEVPAGSHRASTLGGCASVRVPCKVKADGRIESWVPVYRQRLAAAHQWR